MGSEATSTGAVGGQKADRRTVERRGAERVRVKGLWCDRGQVVDLSSRGMRLKTMRRWPEGQVRTLTLVDGGDSVPVDARCVWCRQDSMFSHVVGIAFEKLDTPQLEILGRIAQRHLDGEA